MKGIPTDREIDEMAAWFEEQDELRWEAYCKEEEEMEELERIAQQKY